MPPPEHRAAAGIPYDGRSSAAFSADGSASPPIEGVALPGRRGRRTRTVDVTHFRRPKTQAGSADVVAAREQMQEVQQRSGAVSIAFQTGETLSWGWYRAEGNGPLKVNISGEPLTNLPSESSEASSISNEHEPRPEGPSSLESVVTNYPPQGKGNEISYPEKVARYRDFQYWGVVDINFTGPPPDGQNAIGQMLSGTGMGSELSLDHNVMQLGIPFVVEHVASPFTNDELITETDAVYEIARTAGSDADNDSDSKIKLRKYGGLLEEMRRDTIEGRFHSHLVVGAKTPEELKRLLTVVGMGCKTELPYAATIRTLPAVDNFEDASTVPSPSDPETGINPGISGEMVSRLLPIPKVEHDGIYHERRETFDKNVEGMDKLLRERPGDAMYVGEVLDSDTGKPIRKLYEDIETKKEHGGTWGATGSGKTVELSIQASEAATVENPMAVIAFDPKGTRPDKISMAQRAADLIADKRKRVETLAGMDPAEIEANPDLRVLARQAESTRLAEVAGIKVGAQDKEDSGFNPMDWGSGNLTEYVGPLINVLTSSFGVRPGMDDNTAAETTGRYIEIAIKGRRGFKGIYERAGWDWRTGEPIVPGTNPPKPTLWDLPDIVKEAAEFQGYVGDARDVGPFLEQRAEGWSTGAAGLFFDGNALSEAELFTPGRITVFDISGLDVRDQSLVMGIMLIRINKYLRNNPSARIMSINDEANKLVTDGPVGEKIGVEVAENREFGGAMIFAGQSPDLIPKPVHNNLKTMKVMALGSEAIKAVAGNARMTEDQAAESTTYPQGEMAYFVRGVMDKPVRARVRDIRGIPERVGTVLEPRSRIENADVIDFFAAKEKILMRRMLEQTKAGGKLTGLVDAITVGTLFGLGEVGIADGVKDFDPILELGKQDPKKLKFLVDTAVTRAVNSRAEALYADGAYPREELIEALKLKVHAALRGEQPDENAEPDTRFVLPEYQKRINVKAVLYQHLTNEISRLAAERGVAESQINQNEISGYDQIEELEDILGRPIQGYTALQQLNHVNTHESVVALLFARHAQTGGFFADGPVGFRLKEEALPQDREGSWVNKYRDFLEETLTMSELMRTCIINEQKIHIDAEIAKRERKRNLSRPQATAGSSQGISPEALMTALASAAVVFQSETQPQPAEQEEPRSEDES